MKKILASLLAALLLTGCGWMDGSYVYMVPHVEQSVSAQSGNVSAINYSQLVEILQDRVHAGVENWVIDVSAYLRPDVQEAMDTACRYIMESDPIGAYAVEQIGYEMGTHSGRAAIAVEVQYRYSRAEIQKIRKKETMDGVAVSIRSAMQEHASRMVVLVNNYQEMDFQQIVQDFARENPQTVMEVPQVSEGVYGMGSARVVEVNFYYQNSRETLKTMQTQVKPVFDAASLYVSGNGSEHQKFAQLSGFLMERFDYTVETSITPSYSLLCHGVGDSRAFAEVYSYMCRRAGLQCQVVTGTRNGEARTWNIICDNGYYFHVDLLRSSREGGFREYTDGEMQGYVWDYSAYPECKVPYQETKPQTTEPPATTEVPQEP